MIQVVDEIEELFVGGSDSWAIYSLVGKKTRKLFGVKIVDSGKVRTIYFGEIDRIWRSIEQLTEK
jgi:hypothetical protein